MHKPPSLPMSQIIASDAPLLSPTSETMYQQSLYSPTNDSFTYNYYLPPSPTTVAAESPIAAERVLKMRMVSGDCEEMCISTQKLFDLNEVQHSPTTSPPESSGSRLTVSEEQPRPTISIKPLTISTTAVLKRSVSPTAPTLTARKRNERISTKDFIPPDTSGMSKREARLVKNRAAAFLSRQRKREEFETMEIRVAELEQENARLLALTQKGQVSSHPKSQGVDNDLASEVEMLRAQLANSRQREQELSQELASKSKDSDPQVKVEAVEPSFRMLSPRPQAPHKSAASLGLIVLLCALPTLLSMPTQSPFPTTFSLPTALPASVSSFDFNSILPHDFDLTRQTIMDLDTDEQGRISSLPQKLEFVHPEVSKTLGALGGLDISFDAVPQEDGKIRVRIHPSSSASSSRAASPSAPTAVSTSDDQDALGLGLWGLSDLENPALQGPFSSEPPLYGGVSSSFTAYPTSSSNGDPFFGVGGPSSTDFGGLSPFSSSSSYNSGDGMDLDFGRASDYSPSLTSSDSLSGTKRRVRIALKTLPATGGEGGEWEVQFC